MSIQRVLIYGGKGALGAACVSVFKMKNWWVASIDMSPNENADCNIVVNVSDGWDAQDQYICQQVSESLGTEKLDAILCVAGGWAGGNAASKDLVKSADLMWKQSVWTATIASHLAATYLKEGGLLTLPGAQAATGPTPGMIGYGIAKAAVHQLTKSLAAPKSGLPSGAVVCAVLPVTLDTPMNRKFMPNADYSTWTPLDAVAQMFYQWSEGQDRPTSGSLLQLFTKDGKTDTVIA